MKRKFGDLENITTGARNTSSQTAREFDGERTRSNLQRFIRWWITLHFVPII